ncbi:MAG: HAMP domain-containing sensor histidine kinase [Thermodesulfobacteriota bacterium]
METLEKTRWYFHPVFILVISILALAFSLFLYIYSYVEASSMLQTLALRLNVHHAQMVRYQTWVLVTTLSILVGIILMNIIVFFVYTVKTRQLIRTQRNFIANFTHELKTPVASLRLYTETFLAHDIPKEQRDKFCSYMLADVERLTYNINSILDLARIENKSYGGGDFYPVEMGAFLTELLEQNRHLLANSQIEFDPGGPGPSCRINPQLFSMLFLNLLVNAVKHNESGNPLVRIGFMEEKGRLFISVADNGVGIPKKELKKIFRKFYQLKKPESAPGGNGLGLYVVSCVAKMHKAKASATSQGPGRGSTFTVRLPVVRQKERRSGGKDSRGGSPDKGRKQNARSEHE